MAGESTSGPIEENLRRTEERLRFALWAAKMVAWDWDLVRGQSAWSEPSLELLGLAAGVITV